MSSSHPSIRRNSIVVGLVVSAMVLTGLWHSPAKADVSAVEGSAFGYYSVVSLFGGPANPRPCANPPTNTVDCRPRPSVELPAGGSVVPITDTVPSGDARYGPGIIFTSGPQTVTTQGTTGPTGSVTSTANIQNTNTSGVEVFTADNVASTCTADEAGVTGSTTITNGTLRVSEGDPDVEGDDTVIPVPTNPEPNTAYEGVIEGVGDSFTFIFNEQIMNPDGSLTVNAGHMILEGPTAVGDLWIGQVVCGVTVVAGTTTTVAPTTTVPDGGTTTTVPGATTTTIPGATTTTIPGATTTTLPGATTTTLPGATTTTLTGATTTTVATPGGPIELDADVVGNGEAVRITGTVTCDEGLRFRVMAEVTQDGVEGSKAVIERCTGEPQNFRAKVFPSSGAFGAGSAAVEATVDIWNPDTQTIEDTFTTSEDVTVDVPGGFMGEVVDAVMAMEPPA